MALTLDPADAGTIRDLAEARRGNGENVSAAPLFRHQLCVTPADPVALLAEATSQIDLGYYDTVRRLLQKCLLLAPSLIEAANSYAYICISALALAESRRWFQRTIAAQPLYAPPYSGIAEVYASKAI